MARERVIVGIGEALLCDLPDRAEVGGLAVVAALHAARLGHRAIPISRIGQDSAGDEIIRRLRESNIDPGHIQSDPDLATGRLTVRSIAGRVTRALSPRAAFDNMQWDFDLVDVAQTTDGVLFGNLARREGQSQSIIKRFLAECRNAVRLFDLTNRNDDAMDRMHCRSGLEFAEGVITDAAGLKALHPSWDGREAAEAAKALAREHGLAMIAMIERGDDGERATLFADGQTHRAPAHAVEQHDAAAVALLHALLSGWSAAQCAAFMSKAAAHAAAHPNDALPQS